MNYTLLYTTIAILAAFILFMAGLTGLLYRRITMWGNQEASAAVQTGEKPDTYRVELFGKDEIGDLVKDFNRMETALGVQMKNVAYMTAEREKVRAEMDVATRIQKDMIPCDFSTVIDKGMCDIYGSMTPAKEVGGDFYDFFALDDDRLCVVIADVSGKSVPGALFMTISKVLIKQRAMAGGTPAEILTDVNEQLCADNKEMLFVTVWLGIVDTKTGEVDYCNAGHEYPVVLHGGKCTLLKEDSNEPPLALAEEYPYSSKKMQLQEGDGLFVYTDGVPEAKNSAGGRYGMDRMMDMLGVMGADEPCMTVVDALKKDLASFADSREPFDDVTMLMLRMGKR